MRYFNRSGAQQCGCHERINEMPPHITIVCASLNAVVIKHFTTTSKTRRPRVIRGSALRSLTLLLITAKRAHKTRKLSYIQNVAEYFITGNYNYLMHQKPTTHTLRSPQWFKSFIGLSFDINRLKFYQQSNRFVKGRIFEMLVFYFILNILHTFLLEISGTIAFF